MRLFLSLLLVLISGFTAQAEEVDCTDWEGGSQAIMNICSYEEYLKADAALNEAWAITKAKVDETAEDLSGEYAQWPTLLLEAQRAWLKYRDNHCAAVRMTWAGGSGASLIANLCYTRLTELRTQELIDLAESL